MKTRNPASRSPFARRDLAACLGLGHWVAILSIITISSLTLSPAARADTGAVDTPDSSVSPSPSVSATPSPVVSAAPGTQGQAYLDAVALAKSASDSDTASSNAWASVAAVCGRICTAYVNTLVRARVDVYNTALKAKKMAQQGYWNCPEVFLALKDIPDQVDNLSKDDATSDQYEAAAKAASVSGQVSNSEESELKTFKDIEDELGSTASISGFLAPHCIIYSQYAKKLVKTVKRVRETYEKELNAIKGEGADCASPALKQLAADAAANTALNQQGATNLATELAANNQQASVLTDDLDDGTIVTPAPAASTIAPSIVTDSSEATHLIKNGANLETDPSKWVSEIGTGACSSASVATQLAADRTNSVTANTNVILENQKLYDALVTAFNFRLRTPWELAVYWGVKIADPLVSCAMAATEAPGRVAPYAACASSLTVSLPGRLSCAETGDPLLHKVLERDAQAMKNVIAKAQEAFNLSPDALLSTKKLITTEQIAEFITKDEPSLLPGVTKFLQGQLVARASSSAGARSRLAGNGGLGGAALAPASLSTLPALGGGVTAAQGGTLDVFAVAPRAGAFDALPSVAARAPASVANAGEPGVHGASESIFEVVTKRYAGLRERVQKLDYALPANRH